MNEEIRVKIERHRIMILKFKYLSDLTNKIRQVIFDAVSYEISGFCSKSDPSFSRNFMKPI